MTQLCFRVLSDRYLTTEAELLCWNSRYDLLAISTSRGDVLLQRLFWKKAWQLPPKIETASGAEIPTVGLCWSPDGKHLAVVYATGIIALVEIETGKVNYQIDDEEDETITTENFETNHVCISWVHTESQEMLPSLLDDAELFSLYLTAEKNVVATSITDQNRCHQFLFSAVEKTSLLIVSDQRSKLRLILDGFFHVITIDLSTQSPDAIVMAVDAPANFGNLGVLFRDDRTLRFAVATLPFAEYSYDYWQNICMRIANVKSSIIYLRTCLQKIVDCWDDIVATLDKKLTAFALAKSGGLNDDDTLGDEFLQMLAFGNTSPEMEHFLSNVLTEKGLKKLTSTLDGSYQTSFGLYLNMECAISALLHNLAVLKSTTCKEDIWSIAIEAVGALGMKLVEIQNLAVVNARDLNLFLRWLYRYLQQLSNENSPPHLPPFSNDEIDSIIIYIRQTFCKKVIPDDAPMQFELDRIGRYLKPNDFLDDIDPATTASFSELETFDCPLIYRVDRETTLVGAVTLVRRSVSAALRDMTSVFGRVVKLGTPQVLTETLIVDDNEKADVAKTCLSYDPEKRVYRTGYSQADADGREQFVLREFDLDCKPTASWVLSASPGDALQLININVYRPTVMTVLLKRTIVADDSSRYYLCHFDNALLPGSETSSKSHSVIEHKYSVAWNELKKQALDDGNYYCISVNGPRKVGCTVFACRTRLQLLEMEPDDDTITHDSSLDTTVEAAQ